MSNSAIEALCGHLGIDLAYEDAWGRRHEVDEDTRRALLAALGHPLEEGRAEQHAACELERLREVAAARVLPPLLVLEGVAAPLVLHPRLPAALVGQTLWWRIALEGGGERRGRVAARTREGAGEAGADGERVEAELTIGIELGQGYHRLSLFEHATSSHAFAEVGLAVCPPTCHPAPSGRLWGPSVQVYALRSARDWGMGDFGDLRRLVDIAADAGAHFVGVNPLHALFPHEPERASPYSPSSREWLNVLYLDIEAMRDFGECAAAGEKVGAAAFRARLDALRARTLIDYNGVAQAKFEVLELLYRHFRAMHLERDTQRAGQFRDFQREGGRSLRLHALFDALQTHFHAGDPAIWGWTTWPEAYRDPDGAAVETFAADNEQRIEFFEYLQWQAALQLQAVASRARARGMRVGLYRDLAVGVNEGGSETWARRSLHAFGAHAGAPPDELNANGQDWGFPPQIPQQLADQGYAPFLAVLRANMRHAGALRIDHVMSLMRLFWLPVARNRPGEEGEEARQRGAYVAYPMHDLFRLLCLESRRERCVVIGEDLGIVPQAIREAMARHGLLSYRPLYFQHADGGGFRRPDAWPQDALAVVGTHDLPTLRGYWAGHDIDLREALGMYREPGLRERQAEQRRADCRALLDALGGEALLAPGDEPPGGDEGGGLAPAVYRYIARTPSAMVAVQLEDVLAQLEATNLPGTSETTQPNWRRRLDAALADLAADARWLAVSSAINTERPSAPLPVSGGPPDFRPELADVPRATYRLQFNGDFGFAAATDVLPYLAALGISHVYAAPFLKARPGSRHGYDIVDHQAVNPEIGSDEDFDRYCARLAELGLGQVLDVVPNHVGVLGGDNEWWLDVLENGPASHFADHFDIDWEPPFAELRGKVLLPVLGDQYGLVLEAGELELSFSPERGSFCVRYYEHRFPIDPCDYPEILAAGAADPLPPLQGESRGGEGASAGASSTSEPSLELATLLAALRRLPPRDTADPEALAERRRDKETFKRHLAELYARLPALQAQVAAGLAAYRGHVGEPESFDALDHLLQRQAYRLASWRVAADDINYRRFFDVNDLAALRMENDAVFEATHARIFDWVAQGRVSGLRIDHPDGLADPAAYFERLQTRYGEVAGGGLAPPRALYVVVEKILGEFEGLPADWPVHGGTGYRFANLVNNLFVDPAQESRFTRIYRAFTGEMRDFAEVLVESKQLIMTHSLPGELGSLAYMLYDIAQHDRRTRDFTRSRLRGALAEVIAAFPVYRSYIGPRGVGEDDRRYVERAVEAAVARGLAGDASVLHFVREVLLSAPIEPRPELRRLKLRFVRRFQQFTAPVMAKAMEDTAFYRYNRLVSLNDVGGDPRTFGVGVEDFHLANEALACGHPFGLLATSTHDSKRSEDVRARISVLSEMPGAWRLALRRWGRLNARRKQRVNDEPAPSANDEYLLYQTLLGVWPLGAMDTSATAQLAERVEAYMLKAAREAKRHTSWMNPDAGYEAALTAFVRRLFVPDGGFLADFLPFQATVARFGIYNSLNMLLLKLAAPGVPDIYQGCEDWNFSLVDPDNRRPVDFAAAAARFEALRDEFPDGAGPAELLNLLDNAEDGRIKLYLLWRGLMLRQAFERTLRGGRYVPLDVEGPAARHVVAFARVRGEERVVVIATRLLYGFAGGDAGRVLMPEAWAGNTVVLPWHGLHLRDALCGRELWVGHGGGEGGPGHGIDLGTVFDPLPFALLVAEGGGER
ncbi:putative bifunctional 4-alpha-glucanotransferase/malto-oligosyltrehalose synthase [Azoarcus olearius]|uniref:malto-oligosyltrehalose synthase n=1 Tax=Azoarcus sp. (strain BH72) TaxID=418699 RepID=UPI0008061B57|nr:malto-oligosyltrehalose synthase [Azoarcus olearius]ANQ84986.1 putative bifunctional 4-alpha-glucanotransferase/malto-oligosyltrehalose synthase [Azoarcus olearius]